MEWLLLLPVAALFAGLGAAYGLVLARQRIANVYGELDSAWLKVSRQASTIDQQARTIDRLLRRPAPVMAANPGTSPPARSSRSGKSR
jgi:hypothetical protein